MNKQFALIMIICCAWFTSFAQEGMGKVMEKRAREMHRVIGLDDKEQWKKFVKENYAQSLIDHPMKENVNVSEEGNLTSSSSETKASNNLDGKVKMFGRLHEDFGGSKIISIKPTGEKMEMIVQSAIGLTATFKLAFQKTSPYLIEALGIEVISER